MKKKYLITFALLLIIPLTVLAATPKVLTVSAERSGSIINYSGTTEDGVYAVMCKLYNSSDEEIDMLSSSVNNNEFTGSFTNISDETYSVACARYEGGEVKKVEVVEKANVDKTSDNPQTYDPGIITSIIILIISIVVIVGTIIYLKKK